MSLDAALIDEIKDQSAKQIVDLMTENTRVKVCSESSTADEDSVRVEPHGVLEQNDQLQEQIVKHQKLKKRNAQLHVKLLEEKEKFTVSKQENSMMEHSVGEVKWTQMLQLERVLTCVSEASKDKNAPQRLAGEDDSQILTETQQEFKLVLPTNHEITDVTENAGKMWKFMWKLRGESGNTEFDDAFIATQEGYQKIRSSGDTSGGVRWQNLNTRRTSVNAKLKNKVWSSAQRWLTCGVKPWTTWISLQPRAMVLTKSSTSMTKLGRFTL